jgi:ATP-binding cassette subfamily C protein
MRRKMHRLGHIRVEANTQRYKAANEMMGAIKEVKLLGVEDNFLRAYERPSALFTRVKAEAQFLSEAPRYVLEAVAFGGVVLIAVYFLAQGETPQHVIPALGLYALAGYRLMPSLQQIFFALMQLNFGRAILENIRNELTVGATPALTEHALTIKLPLRESMELRDIDFGYVGSTRQSLQEITLTIPAKTTIGIIGPTGSGKTTLVDVILGLLQPDRGEILIDGAPLTIANLRAWQNSVGYVPQKIYLSDDTIARNIAFGIPPNEINMDAVERAARTAQIHNFVTKELAKGYDTLVGERGVRLSGGQHQRIGVARALYHDPDVLVFDEATSALDTATETGLMDAIRRLAGQKTLIIVAHRLETLKDVDFIVRIKSGKLENGIKAPRKTPR